MTNRVNNVLARSTNSYLNIKTVLSVTSAQLQNKNFLSQEQPCVMIVIQCDSVSCWLCIIQKQEARIERKWHILPLFSLFIPRDTFWWWEQGLHNKQQQHTHTYTCLGSWEPMGLYKNALEKKKASRNHTAYRPWTVKGTVHLKKPLILVAFNGVC